MSSDDLFGMQQDDDQQQINGGDEPVTDIDMLANGSSDDELFSNATQPQQAQQSSQDGLGGSPSAAPSQPSALIGWQNEKNAELQQLDSEERTKNDELKGASKEKLDKHYKSLQDAQEKRKKHNKEVDQQYIHDMETVPDNQWERVVAYIDFNRSDLHEKDVSRMKTLLLQLKH